MQTIVKWTKSVIVVTTNAFLLCGAGYMLDWISYLSKRVIDRIPFTDKRD